MARPSELRRLAERFTAASATLGREMEELKRTLSVHQATRDRTGLIDRLGRVPPLAHFAPAGSPWAWGHLGPSQGSSLAASGAVSEGDRAIAWIARPADDPVEAAARRVEIAVTAEALLTFYGTETEDVIDVLQTLFPAEIAAWVLLVPKGLYACLRQPGLLFRSGADGQRTEIAAPDFAALLRPEPGEVLVLSGPGAPLDALPDATFIPESAGLLAAWRAMAPAGGPRTFAVVALAPAP